MPIINRQDATEVEQHIRRILAASPGERAAELRVLFVEKMDFSGATGSVSLAGAPSTVVFPDRAERVAVMEGLNVVYVALDIEGGIQKSPYRPLHQFHSLSRDTRPEEQIAYLAVTPHKPLYLEFCRQNVGKTALISEWQCTSCAESRSIRNTSAWRLFQHVPYGMK